MIAYNWYINNLERETADGYVFAAHWLVTAEDPDGVTSEFFGVEELPRPETLVPYESLDQTLVLGWVRDKLGADRIAEIEATLAERIETKKRPKIQYGTPW